MPKFAANLTTMFNELDVPERFPAASQSGFTAVEFLYPYAWSSDEVKGWLDAAGLQMILLNIDPGDPERKEVGLASLPGRESDFRSSFEQALSYATALRAGMIHVLAGRSTEEVETSEQIFIENVRWAADLAAPESVRLLLEPLNTQDVPGYLHTRSDHSASLINAIDRDNVKMQFDCYHMQVMEGNLVKQIEMHFDKIGHIQFSSVPGRHEPQHGEVNLPFVFNTLDEMGYQGWIGCEYWAKGNTSDGLVWGEPYGLGASD